MPWHPKNFKPAKNPQFVPPGWQLGTIAGKRVAIAPPEKGRKRGKQVAYNQYLNAQARESGFSSHSDYRKQAKSIAYMRKISGTKIPLGSPLLQSFHRAFVSPETKGQLKPGGSMAQFLEEIGLRPRGATYEVGGTPGAD